VSTEFWIYVVFAIVTVAMGRFRNIAFALLVTASVAILMQLSRYGMRETFDWGIARCAYGFFLGGIAYQAWTRGLLVHIRGNIWEIVSLAVATLFLIFIPGDRSLEYFAPVVFAFLVLAFAGDAGVVSRALSHPWLTKLGAWSYAIYMVQMLVIVLIMSAVVALSPANTAPDANGDTYIHWAMPGGDDALTLAYLGVVIVLAAFTWRFIEIPGQNLARLFKRISSGKVAPQRGG
jgi:hypothetical protein